MMNIFKMSENSLFAILLRSHWAISFAIAIGIALVSRALLPDAYWLYGAFGGFAFIVIGFIALVKQWKLPSGKAVEATHARLAEMTWPVFSAELEKAFVRDGYEIKKGAGVADFIVTRAGRSGIVSAKRWKAAQHSQDMVESLIKARDEHGTADAILISLAPLGEQASKLAGARRIQVMHAEGLTSLLKT